MNTTDHQQQEKEDVSYNMYEHYECGVSPELRIRREWSELSEYDRALYLDAVETAIERGLHQRFVKWHISMPLHTYAHDTCAFFLWHRQFILSYENMLRSLVPRFACLSIPYWNFIDEYQAQFDGTYRCREYGTCSRIIFDLGGTATEVGDEDYWFREWEGIREVGWLHERAPVQNIVDDNRFPGIVRFDMMVERIPPEASLESISKLYNSSTTTSFWRNMQLGVHNRIHDTIGGFMRSQASPIDPIFMPFHASIDLLGYLWELCHEDDDDDDGFTIDENGKGRNGNNTINDLSCLFGTEAREIRNFSFNQEWSMTVEEEEEIDAGAGNVSEKKILIHQDPLIGQFFPAIPNATHLLRLQDIMGEEGDDSSERRRRRRRVRNGYIYNNNALPELKALLESNPALCPNGLTHWINEEDPVAIQNQNRAVPKFSNLEMSQMQDDWAIRAAEYWRDTGSCGSQNTDDDALKSYANCIFQDTDVDTLERWAIDDAFVAHIATMNCSIYSSHGCGHLLSADKNPLPDTTNAPTTTPTNTPTTTPTNVSRPNHTEQIHQDPASSSGAAESLVQFPVILFCFLYLLVIRAQ